MSGVPPPSDLVAEHVVLRGVELDVLRPRDLEALVDVDAFADGEFLPYWAALWPSAPALAELLMDRVGPGDRVLELGCGLALPSLVAARHGADVTASDWAPAALELLADNAERNGVGVEPLRLDWFAAGAATDDPWPLVIAADVLYEARNGPALLAVLERTVAPGGEAWIADPGRRPARSFWPLARERWTVDVLGDPPSGAPAVRRLRRRDRPAG